MLRCAIAGTTDGRRPLADQVLMGAGTGGIMQASQETNPDTNLYWLSRLAPFAYLGRLDVQTAQSATELDHKDETKKMISLLGESKSMSEAVRTSQHILLERMAKIISIPAASVNVSKPVYMYGVDSLVAVELRNWLATELRCDLSIFDLTSDAPISEVCKRIASKSHLVPPEVRSCGTE